MAHAFGPPRFCVEGSSLLVSRGAKPWQGRTVEGSGGPPGTADWQVRAGWKRPLAHHKPGRVVGARARWSPEDVVKSKPAVEEHALTRADMHAHAHAQRATINAHLWRHVPTNTQDRTHTHTHQPTPTNTHAYTHLQDCMSDDSSPRAKTWTCGVIRSCNYCLYDCYYYHYYYYY